MTTLLYGSETRTVYQHHARKLNHFLTTHLRKLLGIKWQDKIPDTEVLALAGLRSIHTLLKKLQLQWAGHVARMPDNRLPKKLLFCELQHGKHSLGGPKKRHKGTLKGSLKSFNLNPDTCTKLQWVACCQWSNSSRKRENHHSRKKKGAHPLPQLYKNWSDQPPLYPPIGWSSLTRHTKNNSYSRR